MPRHDNFEDMQEFENSIREAVAKRFGEDRDWLIHVLLPTGVAVSYGTFDYDSVLKVLESLARELIETRGEEPIPIRLPEETPATVPSQSQPQSGALG